MRVRAGAATDVGLVREHNEDAYLTDPPLFAVADGLGGHQGGEVASRVALETLQEAHRRDGDDLDLVEAVRRANRAVVERAREDPALAGMGTTLTIVRVEGDRFSLAHVGDSRAYLLREDDLSLLTEDHTLVHRMVLEGRLTEAQAEVHPQRSVLTRALGVEEEIAVDVGVHDLRPGDRILLCSDGLTAMVRDSSIREILAAREDPQAAAEALVDAANTAGGVDNTTVVVLDAMDGEGRAAEPAARTAETPAAGAEATAAPAGARRVGGQWRRPVAWTVVGVAVIVVAAVGAKAYVDRQWFVGVSAGRVAIYRGIPAEVLGIELFTLVEETDLPADEAGRLAPWRGLRDGITADSEDEARAIVEQMERDVAGARPEEEREAG